MTTLDMDDPAGVGTLPELEGSTGTVRVVRPPRPSPGSRRVRRVAATVLDLSVVCAMAVCVAFALGTHSGHWNVRTVITGSMAPAIERGDLIIATPTPLSRVRQGDVIIFRAPTHGEVTVHRVERIEHEDGAQFFHTRGDANDEVDPWRLQLTDDEVHSVRAVVPWVGRLVLAVGERPSHVALALVSALVVLVIGLRSIWGSTPYGTLRAGDRSRTDPTMLWRRRGPGVRRGRWRGPWRGPGRGPWRRPWWGAVLVVVILGFVLLDVNRASAGFFGGADASSSTATGQLTVPADPTCSWVTGTTLQFSWSASSSGLENGTRLQRSDSPGGASVAVATTTPVTVAATTVTAPTPVTTPRFYSLQTERAAWSSSPSTELRSDGCRGSVVAFAGTGSAGASGDGGEASAATLRQPRGLAVDPAGTTYVADTANNRVRRVTAAGTITTFAGGPSPSACTYTGPVSSLGLRAPRDVAVDAAGNVYVADTGQSCVRRIDPAGNVTRVAGGGSTTTCSATGAATAVRLSTPSGVAVDGAGNVYIADTGHNCVRMVSGSTYSRVAGGGSSTGCATSGAASAVSLSGPMDVAVDASGTVFIADTGRACVRSITGGNYARVAGGGSTSGCSAASATALSLSSPEGVAVAADGTVFIADSGRRCLRRVAGGLAQPIALTGANGAAGDGGPAVAATARTPSGVTLNSDGDLLFSDRSTTAGSNRVRRVVDP